MTTKKKARMAKTAKRDSGQSKVTPPKVIDPRSSILSEFSLAEQQKGQKLNRLLVCFSMNIEMNVTKGVIEDFYSLFKQLDEDLEACQAGEISDWFTPNCKDADLRSLLHTGCKETLFMIQVTTHDLAKSIDVLVEDIQTHPYCTGSFVIADGHSMHIIPTANQSSGDIDRNIYFKCFHVINHLFWKTVDPALYKPTFEKQ